MHRSRGSTLFFNIYSVQLRPLITLTSSLHRYSAENVRRGKTSYLNAPLWSRHLDNLLFQFVSIPVKEFEYQFFTCAAGVNNSNVGLHKHFLACRSVSICCGFHGDFVSSACVQADRTWPVSSAGARGQVLLFLQTLNLPLFHQRSHQL